jgi:RimJ/RimL family protein N-acetyltransferase
MPTVETERLVLRPWHDDDLPALVALNADPRVMEFFPAVRSAEESAEMLARIRTHWAAHRFGWWVMERRDDRAFVGIAGLLVPGFQASFTPCVEVGWRLPVAAWGQGYATEAARAALQHGFETRSPRLEEIFAFTVPANVRSRRVMERIGMHHDPADDFDHPQVPAGDRLSRHLLYRIRREDWLRSKPESPLRAARHRGCWPPGRTR